MKILLYNGKEYLYLQSISNAAQFAIPYAKHLCVGKGYDIGCHKIEWSFPGSIPVDLQLDNNDFEAFKLPNEKVDYIFSSHCLEHLDNWVLALEYWTERIKIGGTLFLYLPHYEQEYWRPWNNKKHKVCLNVEMIVDCIKSLGYKKIFVGNKDLNNSFMITAER